MKHDSWKRPKDMVYAEYRQEDLNFNSLNIVEDATPEEVDEWMNTDYFMKGEFDVMKLFVLVPALIQVTVFFMMLFMFYVNSLFY